MKTLATWSALLVLATLAYGADDRPTLNQETYVGLARRDGTLVYREFHSVAFDDDGRVRTAKTEYRTPDGRLFAVLESDFRASLPTPEHEFRDFRFQHRHGTRFENGRVLLFTQDGDQREKTRVLDRTPEAGGIVFGCQGLHYFLRENVDAVNAKGKLPVVLLAPKSLDSYRFVLSYDGTTDGASKYEVQIENFLLRLFAPRLVVFYEPGGKRLLRYSGVSNILDESGKIQNVDIHYVYDGQGRGNADVRSPPGTDRPHRSRTESEIRASLPAASHRDDADSRDLPPR